MSDYSVTTDFSAKDALSTGDPEKLILGSDFDTEFDNIATAVATKYDSGDLASQAQAEAAINSSASNVVLLTPLRLWNWASDNAGIVEELQALADPGADRILFWDDGEAAGSNVAFLTVANGVEISGTTLQMPSSAGGAGLTYTSGILAVGAGSGITVNANDVQISDVSAGSNNPVNISGGTFTFDITALTDVEADGIASTDTFIVDDAGTAKKIQYGHLGMIVQTAQTTQTLAAADANTIMEFNGTATVTIPVDATHTWPPGAGCLICVDHASQQVTISVGASVTLNSVFNPGGGTSTTDKVLSGGTAALIYLGSDEWYLSGDITD